MMFCDKVIGRNLIRNNCWGSCGGNSGDSLSCWRGNTLKGRDYLWIFFKYFIWGHINGVKMSRSLNKTWKFEILRPISVH